MSSKFLTANPSLGIKLLFSMLGLAVLAGPAAPSLANPSRQQPQSPPISNVPLPYFEVASIKLNRSGDRRGGFRLLPGRFTAINVRTQLLVSFAYGVQNFQVLAGPNWIESDGYDIDAKVEDSLAEKIAKLPPGQRADQFRLMVQSLLANRFRLKVSHETRDLPVYALVVAKNGPKLQEENSGTTYPDGVKGANGAPLGPHTMGMRPGQITGQGVSMAELAMILSQQVSRRVLDQTGLKGNYDFTLKWAPEQNPDAAPMGRESGRPTIDGNLPAGSFGPSLFTALPEQLGLKLESTKGPVEVFVIDHIGRPSEN